MRPNRTFKAAWKPGTKKTTKDDLYCIKMRKRNEDSTRYFVPCICYSEIIFLTRLLFLSNTYTVPYLSTARPVGALNAAASPIASE